MKKFVFAVVVASFTMIGASGMALAQEKVEQRKEVRLRAMLYAADYQSMMALVQKQRFAEAFPEIMRFARYGEKYAQYLAGLLLVSGQDVPENVEQGLVWMRLSLEQDTTDWKRRYEELTKNLTQEQLDALNPLYEEYKQKYGAKSQFMRCGYERLKGSNMRKHTCRKNLLMNEYYNIVEYHEDN